MNCCQASEEVPGFYEIRSVFIRAHCGECLLILFNINFNIILPSVPFTSMLSLSFRFTDQHLYASHHPCILVDLTAYLLLFDPNNIW